MDIHGGSATIQTRNKSRLTDGFNILKIDKDILYILSIVIGEENEMHKIYKIKASKDMLNGLDTSLEGYNEKKLLSIIGDEMPEPCSLADSLTIILDCFANFPGHCDVVVKRVRDLDDKINIKLIPLVTPISDEHGNVYYPYSGGNFRDVLELAIKADEIIEYKVGNYNNIRNKSKK